MQKFLVIPIEMQKRELPAVCKLISEAINSGWSIFFGQKQQLFPFIKILPKSTWFLKSLVPGELSLLNKIKEAGHYITSLDIEGLILPNTKIGYQQRYSRKTINISDGIFFWSQNHLKNFLKVFKKIPKKKLFLTGSHVNDIWIENIPYKRKESKKKTILIIPSFGYANSLINNLNLDYALDNFGIKRKEDIRTKREKSIIKDLELEFKSQVLGYKSFNKIIPILSKRFKNYKIIIRPHPMEDISLWKNASKLKNVYIEKNKDLISQIQAANFIIHFNSTISVQCALLKKKTILFFDIDKKYKKVISPICIGVSHFVTNMEKLIKILSQSTINENKKDKIKFYINRVDKNETRASRKIINIIDKKYCILNSQMDLNNYLSGYFFKFFYIYYEFLNNILVPMLSYFSMFGPLKRFHHGRIYRKYKISRKELIRRKWADISLEKMKMNLRDYSGNKQILSKCKLYKHFSGHFYLENNINK